MHADNTIRVRTLTGAAILNGLRDFQALHVEVFYDWPYLFQGNVGETAYIARYALCPRAALFLAYAGDTPIGAATCLPLSDENDSVQAPFRARGLDLRRFFYFGEGVILKQWRGKGLGVKLFELRESHARAVSTVDFTSFCSVRRPADHPLRPADATTNDAFWRRRGYQPFPGMACTMTWRDRGEGQETPHTLDFWIKSLNGAAIP